MWDITKHNTSQIFANWTGSYLNIYGDRIVWMNGPVVDGSYHSDIYMYNLSTAEMTRITNSTYASEPDIYGDNIVYIDPRNDFQYKEIRDIYSYNHKANEAEASF